MSLDRLGKARALLAGEEAHLATTVDAERVVYTHQEADLRLAGFTPLRLAVEFAGRSVRHRALVLGVGHASCTANCLPRSAPMEVLGDFPLAKA
jgi:hypothetical protein